MNRPAQARLSDVWAQTDTQNFEVLKPDGLWVLTYRGEFVNICKTSRVSNGIKYPRTTWTTESVAHSQCEKYNAWSRTQDFGILRLL